MTSDSQLEMFPDPEVTRTSAPTVHEWKKHSNPPRSWVHETNGGLVILLEGCPECGASRGRRCKPDFSYKITNPDLGGFGVWYAFHPQRVRQGNPDGKAKEAKTKANR